MKLLRGVFFVLMFGIGGFGVLHWVYDTVTILSLPALGLYDLMVEFFIAGLLSALLADAVIFRPENTVWLIVKLPVRLWKFSTNYNSRGY